MEPILQVKNLTHTYGAGTPFERSAVQDMSFDVYDGEFLGIIGHTGSGKSTLIQHLNGLLRPTSGQILLDGKDIWAEPKKIRNVRFQVGLVFQYPEYQLFEETVYKDIAYGPTNMGRTGDELDRCVREAAKIVGIRDDQLFKSPFELSGGQKRRVALAGVLAMEPRVLILDEPTAGLDPAGRENLMANIRDYHRNKKMTVILVSHSMDEIAQNVDRILVLKSSHVLMSGTPAEVFARGEELLSAGLDVPQVTRVAMRLREKGLYLAGVPGFYKKQGQWTLKIPGRGILIPVRDVRGQIQGLQVRLDNVEKRKFRWLSSNGLEEGCGAKTWVHLAGEPRPLVLLTEGPMKADVIHFLTGQTVLAVAGVNSLSQLRPVLEELRAAGMEQIMTAFDMDYLINPHVRAGQENLAHLLDRCGISYGTYLWDPRYKGLDDYIWGCLCGPK